jgi:tubulin gamma
MIERLPERQLEEVQTPLLENMVIGVPPVFEGLTRELDKLVEQPLLGPRIAFPRREYYAN